MSLITNQQALKIITEIPFKSAPITEQPLRKAAGCILAEDVTTGRDIPPFNRAAMDGYAVRCDDLQKTPCRLEVVAVREAGDGNEVGFGSGQCVKIMTGAAVPDDADAVVKIEDTESDDPAKHVNILHAVRFYENIARRGEDTATGSVVLSAGQGLSGPALAVAAGVGRAKLKVYPQPEIALLQTGGELIEPGNPVEDNQIYNSNGTLLAGLINDNHIGSVRYLGISPDDRETLAAAIREGLQSRVMLLTGGVSMGDFDYVPQVLESCGVKLHLHGVAIKPGKPLLFGSTARGSFVFGLPGNPVSVMVCFEEFVVPLLRRLAGWREGILHADLSTTVTETVRKKPGRVFYCSARLSWRDGELLARPVFGHGSGDYTAAAYANGTMIIPGETTVVKAGEKAAVHLWQLALNQPEGS